MRQGSRWMGWVLLAFGAIDAAVFLFFAIGAIWGDESSSLITLMLGWVVVGFLCLLVGVRIVHEAGLALDDQVRAPIHPSD